MNIGMLETHGFVPMEYPKYLRSSVARAAQTWQAFCDLPEETKRQLSNGHRVHDFGYMLRNGKEADHKEQFHLKKKTFEELQLRASRIDDSRALEFVTAVNVLRLRALPLVQSIARSLEETYDLEGFQDEVLSGIDSWIIRCIHYFPADILARPHVDKGGLTFHLYETDQGGQCLDKDKQWVEWPITESHTVAFPGLGLQYRSGNTLKALCHQVVSTERTRREGRYSMVMFANFKTSHRYNEVSRLQDFTPGFNYDLTLSALKRLFVPT